MLAFVPFLPSSHELQLSWKPAWCSYSPSLVFVLIQRIAPGGRCFLWRFPAFAWCTVWSWSLIVLSAPPYLRHAYCRARSRELDRSLWSSALSGSPPLHCCCCCLTQTLCCTTATNLQKFQSSHSDPATSQLPTRPSKRDNMPKIEFSDTTSKIITKIYKKLSLKLLPNFHIFQSSEFWTSYLSQLNLFLGFDFFSALNYNVIQEIGTKVAAFLHDKSTLCMAIARVQATVQIWKQELHTTEFTRNAETEIQERIFSCNFVIFSDMCVPQ